MNMYNKCCGLFIIFFCLSLAGADYAELEAFLHQQANNETFVRLYEEHAKHFQDDSNNVNGQFSFTCQTYPRPSSQAVSVHELTPMDIKVVAALGDSITAGTGITALTPLGLLRQDRQLSWSIGGKGTISEEKTLPNILKVYNPDITGYSTGWGPVGWESVSHLNVAHPGDKSEDIPDQAKLLVERMKKAEDIDFENDWKMITLFVGGNDLCVSCTDKARYNAITYRDNLQTALDYLHEHVPKAFVNFVEVLDVAVVKRLNANLICDALHLYGCSCAAFPWNSKAEQDLIEETDRYRKLTEELINSGRYDTREDFTVVIQPFWSKTILPDKAGTDKPDLSYFAPDCFHLSLKGHRAATEALWDNLVEPVGKKRVSWTPNEKLECPTESSPYFYTNRNSDPSYRAKSVQDQPKRSKLDQDQPSGLGAMFQNGNPVEDSQTDDSKTSGFAVSTTTVVIVIGGVIVLVGLMGLIVFRYKKRRQPEERELLLKEGDLRIYA